MCYTWKVSRVLFTNKINDLLETKISRKVKMFTHSTSKKNSQDLLLDFTKIGSLLLQLSYIFM